MNPKNFDDLFSEAEEHDDYWIAGSNQAFAEEICRQMERDGVSRSELAGRLGISPAHITEVLRGDADVTLAMMVRLSKALGADLGIQLVPVVPSRSGRDMEV